MADIAKKMTFGKNASFIFYHETAMDIENLAKSEIFRMMRPSTIFFFFIKPVRAYRSYCPIFKTVRHRLLEVNAFK